MLRVVDSFKGTDTGRQRRANEDAAFERAPLFAVADGMGGAQAGEVASRIAVDALEGGLPDGSESAQERLAELVREANVRIHDLSRADEERAGMGTTITAAYLGEEELSVAHVGDSRLYVLRDGSFERLTRDHSLVDELVREGKLTPEEADVHPQRSIITRALGPERDVDVDGLTWRARAGDVYLICSDGLTSMVAESEVARIVTDGLSSATQDRPGRLAPIGTRLIEAANAAGGRDNITVVLFRVDEVDFAGAAAGAEDATGEQATQMGAGALTVDQVREASAVRSADPVAAAPPAERRMPRVRAPTPEGGAKKPRGKVGKTVRAVAIALAVLFPFVAGGYIASQAVYFVGVDDDGFVSVFKGVPYELPGGLEMYSENFVSGVPAATLPVRVRETVTEHKLRSLEDANDLVRALERGEVAGQGSR